jgi:glycosyltransferase involved in cell wall biosynthesis
MLTVLFSTRNGAGTLRAVFESYGAVESPPGGWKLVVVDNGSTDDSKRIIAEYAEHLPLTYVFEGSAGKNRALNTGLGFVDGDLVVLTDDDVFPAADWLIRLREAADGHPSFGVFGGRVVPRWESTPPAWIVKWIPLSWTYTASSPALPEGPVEARQVFGPNMAVRADLFRAGHRFRTSIGPDGTSDYAMGSETEFVLRLVRAGIRTWYAPAAGVEHFVRTRQLTVRWLMGRARRAGRSEYRLGDPVPTTLIASDALRKAAGVLVALVRFDMEHVVRRTWALCFLYGMMLEAISSRTCHKENEL